MERLLAEARAALARLWARPDRLPGLAPFEAALEDPTPTRLLEYARARELPVVGTVCALAPLEVIVGAGAVPVRLDAGSAECAAAAGESLHRDACPLVRSLWGLLSSLRDQGLLPPRLPLVLPRTCDWKAALPEQLAGAFDIEILPLDVPRAPRTETASHDWRRQVRSLAAALERTTGQRVTKDRLREAIALYRRASAVSRALSAAMAADNPPLWGGDLLLALSASLLMPLEEWIEVAEALRREIRARLADEAGVGADRPRLLLAGSPCVWPHFGLPSLAEECGGVVVADESCTGSRLLADAVRTDEVNVPDLLDAIADRYLLPSTCPIFADPEDRLLRLEVLVEDFRPEGAIYHVVKSCFVYDMQLAAAQERLQALGVPVLRIETDYAEADEESLRTRLEAFVETLRHRRAVS